MLDNTTKQKINTLRDILVGKVSDPKSQVEQITIALFYKFMEDMDNELIHDLGVEAKFFSGEYAKYSWRNLFAPSLSGEDMLNLYREAVEKMEENPNIPSAFRDIFKRAYLPYNDPATLRMFLKVIDDGFHYSHSEMLGDAFEYLLSILGTQGDAGQFRTPRHIIDFVAACVNPQKGDVICDPACGTAGFVIAAYKHILKQNTKTNTGDLLSAEDKKKLAQNLIGLDIDPMMVKLALANMYLHGFNDPHIYEYDSLTSEDKWDDTYDVVLANPPFMTPKGGIRPHKRFTTQANKAEVLFVDLISSHLTANGRAGIIVPNGIVATTQTAYKKLRKILVDDSLIAVVSLPAGVFQPYSGVKTSILILDKALSKKSDSVLFIKVENDGFDLGAQRREIDKNDLPNALVCLNAYKNKLQIGGEFVSESQNVECLLVDKKKILENSDLVLSGDRYVKRKKSQTKFELVKLGEVCDVRDGTHDSPKYLVDGGYPLITSKNIINGKLDFQNVNLISREDLDKINKRSLVDDGDLIMPMIGTIGNPIIVHKDREFAIKNVALIKSKIASKINNVYLKYILGSDKINNHFLSEAKGVAQKYLSLGFLRGLEIPLPPIEIQEKIVAEIEGHQKIIEQQKRLIEIYEQKIKDRVAQVWGEE